MLNSKEIAFQISQGYQYVKRAKTTFCKICELERWLNRKKFGQADRLKIENGVRRMFGWREIKE